MNLIVFEDEFVTRLHPITIGRAAYSISCGGRRLSEFVPEFSASARGVVRDYLAPLQAIDFPQLGSPASEADAAANTLLLNARVAPSVAAMERLKKRCADGHPFVAKTADSIAAALLPPTAAIELESLSTENVVQRIRQASEGLPLEDLDTPLFEYPHDVVRIHLEILVENLEHRLRQGGVEEVRDGVFAAEGATFGDHVVSDTRSGPILLEANASVGPCSYLNGPAWLGRGARVIEHAALKDGVAVGHTTKIGGEVEASIIEPFTNKQHYGFLGHSYLGSWINLGAGTCNSDLKNTYGLVNMEYGGVKVSTGMQFVGCVMGDYAKTAINTGIFTGKTIGACSMLYGFVTENVPSFVNYARLFGQVAELPAEVMIATQTRMFVRRSVTQRECDRQLIREMFELTRADRDWPAGAPLML